MKCLQYEALSKPNCEIAIRNRHLHNHSRPVTIKTTEPVINDILWKILHIVLHEIKIAKISNSVGTFFVVSKNTRIMWNNAWQISDTFHCISFIFPKSYQVVETKKRTQIPTIKFGKLRVPDSGSGSVTVNKISHSHISPNWKITKNHARTSYFRIHKCSRKHILHSLRYEAHVLEVNSQIKHFQWYQE